eukprot:COSAG02_NODE_37865_length_436_cov_1.148368_1_plen_40_part_10
MTPYENTGGTSSDYVKCWSGAAASFSAELMIVQSGGTGDC